MLTQVLPTTGPRHWSVPKRIAFRFAFAYLVLYHVDAFIGLLAPIFRLVGAPIGPRAVYRMPWNGTATWIAVHAFSIDREVLGHVVWVEGSYAW